MIQSEIMSDMMLDQSNDTQFAQLMVCQLKIKGPKTVATH